MRKIFLFLPIVMFCLCMQANNGIHQVINLNFGWQFHHGKADSKHLNAISDWRTIDVPHDFLIEQPWVAPDQNEKANNNDPAANRKSRLSSRGFKEMGQGWYRKTYIPEVSLRGKRIVLDFEGIMYVGDVFLNGERIGGTDYGYLGFDIDISKKLKYGQPNEIAVCASTMGPDDSRWYTGAGLFRDVRLLITDNDLYFSRHPLYITTQNNKQINVQAEVANFTKQDDVNLEIVILDAKGQVVAKSRKDYKFNRRMRTNELKLDSFQVVQPHLWSCEDPYLYTMQVSLYNKEGQLKDVVKQRFGIRTIEIGPDFGLRVNGKKVLLKGNANHHTLGALGAAAYPRAIEKRLQMLKSFGFNHIRTSHNPYSTSFLDKCDEMGILVVDEIYDKWLKQYTGGRKDWESTWPHDLPEWIKRDRNHPSVIMWSLGNELQTYASLPFGDWGVTPYRMMLPVLKRYDNTRKVTVAMHPRGRNWDTDSLPCDLAMITDVQAYNYRYMYFPGDGKRFPWMTFYQSEANNTMMGTNFFAMNLDKVMGLAYWGMIDYLGESMGWPAKGWTQGAFDLSLQPKPKAYLLKSMFLPDTPVVQIGIVDKAANSTEWNGITFKNDEMTDHWNRTLGEKYNVNVYTNAEKVVLMVNGKKVGEQFNTKDPNGRNRLLFKDVNYEPGYIEAIAYINNNVVARQKIETTGEAKKLKLIADIENWKADGQDLQHIRIQAVDSKGRRVYAANNDLMFKVEGDARIIAVDNGNLYSNELHVANHRHLYNGSALVILRAGKTPSKITLTVTSKDFKTQKITLKTL
ncbi:glycoside hydrolase family 2 TIM barrel-domain containing protein [Segatella baroniae]|uniref:glycoside hydrolase family 2 TIM barrel-domain containing protein n=1 Tax=Segatella baroniae TaxID=305719 RepID=UPI000488354A|nr:glycoside hydrolase family 2 TIM barrel-domain containing protein [Segatella baroniae]